MSAQVGFAQMGFADGLMQLGPAFWVGIAADGFV